MMFYEVNHYWMLSLALITTEATSISWIIQHSSQSHEIFRNLFRVIQLSSLSFHTVLMNLHTLAWAKLSNASPHKWEGQYIGSPSVEPGPDWNLSDPSL